MTQVVIIGAGPTGLTLAMLLAERGIAVKLIEASRSFRRVSLSIRSTLGREFFATKRFLKSSFRETIAGSPHGGVSRPQRKRVTGALTFGRSGALALTWVPRTVRLGGLRLSVALCALRDPRN